MLIAALASLLIGAVDPQTNVPREFGGIVQKIGPWDIYRLEDRDPDHTECVAIYNGNAQIQLETYRFSILSIGNLVNYKTSYGSDPAEYYHHPSQIEFQSSSIFVDGIEFNRFAKTDRFTIKIETVKNNTTVYQIDNTSIDAVFQSLNRCE